MDASWAQWILGAALGVTQLVVGWIGHRLYEFFKEISTLKTEVALLQARPHIDPIEYTRAMMTLANSITNLTEQLATNDRHRTEQISSLSHVVNQLRNDLEELKRELLAPELGR